MENTPLYLASFTRDLAAVQALLEGGANVNLRSKGSYRGPPYQPPRPQSRFNKPELGYTALHAWANLARSSQPCRDVGMVELEEVLKLLIEFGCDINAQDPKGQTALFAWPKYTGFKTPERAEQFITLLLKYGADVSITDNQGSTPLHVADRSIRKQKSTLRTLINAGVNANAMDGDGRTALIMAAKAQLMDPSVFDGFNVDFNLQDSEGNTALHYACLSWCME